MIDKLLQRIGEQIETGIGVLETDSEGLPGNIKLVLQLPALMYVVIVCWPIGAYTEWRRNRREGIRTVRD